MMGPPNIGNFSLYKWEEGPLYEGLSHGKLFASRNACSFTMCMPKCEEEEVPRHNLYQCIQLTS